MKLEYGNLYKFIVSLATIILLTPFIIYGFIVNNSEILLTEDCISTLYLDAKILLLQEYDLYNFLLKNKLWIFIACLLVGILILRFGIKKWSILQNNSDNYEFLKTTEIARRLNCNSMFYNYSKLPNRKLDRTKHCNLERSDVSNFIKDNILIDVENNVKKYLKKKYKPSHETVINAQISNYSLDFVAISKKYMPDIIFDIGYVDDVKLLKDAINVSQRYLTHADDIYYKAVARYAECVTLIVYSDKIKNEIDEFCKTYENICPEIQVQLISDSYINRNQKECSRLVKIKE